MRILKRGVVELGEHRLEGVEVGNSAAGGEWRRGLCEGVEVDGFVKAGWGTMIVL